jgi:hypothetical protein
VSNDEMLAKAREAGFIPMIRPGKEDSYGAVSFATIENFAALIEAPLKAELAQKNEQIRQLGLVNDRLRISWREDTAAEKQRANAAESERDALRAKLDAIGAVVAGWLV